MKVVLYSLIKKAIHFTHITESYKVPRDTKKITNEPFNTSFRIITKTYFDK